MGMGLCKNAKDLARRQREGYLRDVALEVWPHRPPPLRPTVLGRDPSRTHHAVPFRVEHVTIQWNRASQSSQGDAQSSIY